MNFLSVSRQAGKGFQKDRTVQSDGNDMTVTTASRWRHKRVAKCFHNEILRPQFHQESAGLSRTRLTPDYAALHSANDAAGAKSNGKPFGALGLAAHRRGATCFRCHRLGVIVKSVQLHKPYGSGLTTLAEVLRLTDPGDSDRGPKGCPP